MQYDESRPGNDVSTGAQAAETQQDEAGASSDVNAVPEMGAATAKKSKEADGCVECESSGAPSAEDREPARCDCSEKPGCVDGETLGAAEMAASQCSESIEPGLAASLLEAEQASEAARKRREAVAKDVKEYVQSILMAVVLAMLIMAFIGRSFVVDGASMQPTLHNGERIIVEKVSYRFTTPKRGDIIVLKNPWRPDQSGFAAVLESMKELVDLRGTMRPYIKRIVGVAGDTIEISDGTVYLNGKALNEQYILEPPQGHWGPYNVPDGCVFVMGDNRNNSDDSRGSVGYLKITRIVGRASVRYYPFNRMTRFKRPDVY